MTIKHVGGRPADLVQKWTTLDQLPKQRKLATRTVRQTLDQLSRTLSHFAILIENSKEFAGGHRTYGSRNPSSCLGALRRHVIGCHAVCEERTTNARITQSGTYGHFTACRQVCSLPTALGSKSSLSWPLPSGHSQKGLKHAYSY